MYILPDDNYNISLVALYRLNFPLAMFRASLRAQLALTAMRHGAVVISSFASFRAFVAFFNDKVQLFAYPA